MLCVVPHAHPRFTASYFHMQTDFGCKPLPTAQSHNSTVRSPSHLCTFHKPAAPNSITQPCPCSSCLDNFQTPQASTTPPIIFHYFRNPLHITILMLCRFACSNQRVVHCPLEALLHITWAPTCQQSPPPLHHLNHLHGSVRPHLFTVHSRHPNPLSHIHIAYVPLSTVTLPNVTTLVLAGDFIDVVLIIRTLYLQNAFG